MWYKLKRIMMRPNGVEKQVRPNRYILNTHTVAYYPLTSSTQWNDMSGNWYNMVAENSKVQFWINQWVDCASFDNSQATSWLEAYLWTTSFNRLSWASARTFSFWSYNTNSSLPAHPEVYVFQWKTGTNRMVLIASGEEFSWAKYWISQRWASWWFGNITRWVWQNNIITYDWSKFEWYINWVTTWTWNYTINTSGSNLMIWWVNRDTINNNWYSFNGYMSDFIVEDRAWTAGQCSNYYNLTKRNYWL